MPKATTRPLSASDLVERMIIMSTIIIAVVVFGAVALVIYNRFLKKGHAAAGCHECSEIGCPLVEQAKTVKTLSKKKA